MKALAYLVVRRFLNSLKQVPRNPRVLVPTLFLGFAFLWPILAYFLLPGVGGERPPSVVLTPGDMVSGDAGKFAASIRALLLLSLFGSVTAAYSEGNLFFTPSDVDFLFPAPLSRRAVLLFKMTGTYLSLILPVIYFPFLLGGPLAAQWGRSPVVFWPGMVGAWLLLIAASNGTQVILTGRGEETDDDRRAKVQKVLAAAGFVLGAAVLLLVYYLFAGPGIRDLDAALRLLNSRLVGWLFLPVTWVVDLFFLGARGGWVALDALKLLALAALTGGSFLLLFSRDRDFYEGAMAVSARRHRMVSAVRRGNADELVLQMVQEGKIARREGVTALSPFGSGALAIVWRDLLATLRTPTRSWLTLAIFAIVPAAFGRGIGGQHSSGVGVLLWLVFFTVNVSNVFLLSIRGLLRRADITKALPISPPRLLLAENAVSIVLLTVLGWVSLGGMWLLGVAYAPLMGMAFFALPTLAALILLVQTCFVMLYPNRDDQAQTAVGNLLGIFASTLALFPSASVAIALVLLGAGYPLITVAVMTTNLVATGAVLAFASFLWQRFDPTD